MRRLKQGVHDGSFLIFILDGLQLIHLLWDHERFMSTMLLQTVHKSSWTIMCLPRNTISLPSSRNSCLNNSPNTPISSSFSPPSSNKYQTYPQQTSIPLSARLLSSYSCRL